MEYRGIRYTIRAGIERGHWFVVIHPEETEVLATSFSDRAQRQELMRTRMINRWLEPKSKQKSKQGAIRPLL